MNIFLPEICPKCGTLAYKIRITKSISYSKNGDGYRYAKRFQPSKSSLTCHSVSITKQEAEEFLERMEP